jgi:hypothetical protein
LSCGPPVTLSSEANVISAGLWTHCTGEEAGYTVALSKGSSI